MSCCLHLHFQLLIVPRDHEIWIFMKWNFSLLHVFYFQFSRPHSSHNMLKMIFPSSSQILVQDAWRHMNKFSTFYITALADYSLTFLKKQSLCLQIPFMWRTRHSLEIWNIDEQWDFLPLSLLLPVEYPTTMILTTMRADSELKQKTKLDNNLLQFVTHSFSTKIIICCFFLDSTIQITLL